jgi:hypothetical protein
MPLRVPSFLAGSINLQVGDFAVAVKRPQFALYFVENMQTQRERNEIRPASLFTPPQTETVNGK